MDERETLPAGWVAVSLEAIVDVLDRFRVPINADERATRVGQVPYYGATGQVGWIDSHLFDEELILLGEDGAPFLDSTKPTAYMIRGKSWVNNHAHVLRGKSGILNAFLMYQLNQTDFHPFVSGTTRLKLPQAPMLTIPLKVAPEAEQHRIVAEIEKQFSRLDAAVAALERVRANLKRYRAAVLKAACEGRLVPTEAEVARAEERAYEPADVLLTRILEERRAKWTGKGKYQEPQAPDTSALPELPEGWAWATWEQLSRRVTVGHVGPMRNEYVKDGVPFLRSQNVRENRFDPENLLHIPKQFHEKLAKSVLHPGDVVVVRSGNVGVTCVIPPTLVEANCSDLVIIQDPNGVVSQYGAYYMNSAARSIIKAGQVGIALSHFNTQSVASLNIAVPPLAEQHRIVAEVERRLSVVEQLEATVAANLRRAERLRQAVLKLAFAGKLVPQDPTDEPASVLLERIRTERAAEGAKGAAPKTARAGRLKRDRTTPVADLQLRWEMGTPSAARRGG